ncbi:MAG TPA: phospholipase D-like domain-containing protein [Gemmatimonadaceae bacterium]|nr:phospholipase D-like domain-containing protein [Gemmatimonadaceae bacterium]
MAWTIITTALVTFLVVMIALNFARPEKKLTWRIEHRYAVTDTQFRREMGVMLGPSISGGNRVTALQNGVEIFPAMLDAIRSAQTSITFETYIYWSGEIGQTFSEALSERARAGIPVNVTVDWVGSARMDRTLLEEMQEAGVDVRRYRPLRWYNFRRLNYRTHRKLLVVDGRIGFTGGVGIADLWQGNAEDPDHWRETHFRVEGPVVAQFQAAFNDNWIKSTGELLNGTTYFPALTSAGALDAHLFIASPAGGSESMHLMYLLAIAAAKQSIDLAASYFVPDELAIQAFEAARKRGVRVRVLLPGPWIDTEAVRLASKGTWGRLLQAGVEIYVYQPTMLHTKMLIIDRELVSVGSTNFDPRSFRLNDEANLNVYDTAFATQMTGVFEGDLKSGMPYTYDMWKRRPLGEKLAEKLLRPIRSQL